MRVWLAFACCMAATGAAAEEQPDIPDHEDRVMQIIFDECLNYLKTDMPPFEEFPLLPITEAGLEATPAFMPMDKLTVNHIFNTRYVAIWGRADPYIVCQILTIHEADGALEFGVRTEGFLDRLSARTKAAGFTESDYADAIERGETPGFSALETYGWYGLETDEDQLRMIVMPTQGNATMSDAGLIATSRKLQPDEEMK